MKTNNVIIQALQMLLMPAILAVGVWGLLVVPAGAVADVPITLEIPVGNINEVAGLEQYLSVLYQFIISAIAILSVVMLMFNGMRWATAGGSSEMVGVAKEGVISAFIGLIIALTSFLLLNIINPALVNFLDITLPPFTGATNPTTDAGGRLAINGCSLDTRADALYEYSDSYDADLTQLTKSAVPDVNRCPASARMRDGIGGSLTNHQVRNAVTSAEGNISPILMLAMMKAESDYCSNAWSTFTQNDVVGHACGVVQMKPETAAENYANDCSLEVTRTADGQLNKDATCDTIIENPAKAICMMGLYINQMDNTSHTRENNQADIAASYNGGRGAVLDSNGCAGLKRWECEEDSNNDGELDYEETRKYVRNIRQYKDELCRNLGGEVIEVGETQFESDGQCVEFNSNDPDCNNVTTADGDCNDAFPDLDPDCSAEDNAPTDEEEADASAEEEEIPAEEEIPEEEDPTP